MMDPISREEEELEDLLTNKSLWKIDKRDLFANIKESKSETTLTPNVIFACSRPTHRHLVTEAVSVCHQVASWDQTSSTGCPEHPH